MNDDESAADVEALRAEHRRLDEQIRVLSSEPMGDSSNSHGSSAAFFELKDKIQRILDLNVPEILDVESVAGHLLPAGSVFAFLAEHRRELFPDEMFADLFPSGRGRPSVPAEVIASVIVLQALHGLSDAEAADAVTFDLRWKAACGLPVDRDGVPSDDVDRTGGAAGRLGPAEPDLRRGPGGGRRRPGCWPARPAGRWTRPSSRTRSPPRTRSPS